MNNDETRKTEFTMYKYKMLSAIKNKGSGKTDNIVQLQNIKKNKDSGKTDDNIQLQNIKKARTLGRLMIIYNYKI